METSETDKDLQWQKTPVANLVRNASSGLYYARVRVRGKLIWKSLKTDCMSVAKLRFDVADGRGAAGAELLQTHEDADHEMRLLVQDNRLSDYLWV